MPYWVYNIYDISINLQKKNKNIIWKQKLFGIPKNKKKENHELSVISGITLLLWLEFKVGLANQSPPLAQAIANHAPTEALPQ